MRCWTSAAKISMRPHSRDESLNCVTPGCIEARTDSPKDDVTSRWHGVVRSTYLEVCSRSRGVALDFVQAVGERRGRLLRLQLRLQDLFPPPLCLALLRPQPSLQHHGRARSMSTDSIARTMLLPSMKRPSDMRPRALSSTACCEHAQATS